MSLMKNFISPVSALFLIFAVFESGRSEDVDTEIQPIDVVDVVTDPFVIGEPFDPEVITIEPEVDDIATATRSFKPPRRGIFKRLFRR